MINYDMPSDYHGYHKAYRVYKVILNDEGYEKRRFAVNEFRSKDEAEDFVKEKKLQLESWENATYIIARGLSPNLGSPKLMEE